MIRNESIGDVAWDVKSDGTFLNDWSKATGMTLLNSGDYWNRTGSYSSTGLLEESKLLIDDAKWYLGGTSSYNGTSNGLVNQFYEYERSTTVYGSNPISWIGKVGLMYPSDFGYATSGGTSSTARSDCLSRTLFSWYSNCASYDWLYSGSNFPWTITSYTDAYSYAFHIYSGNNSIGRVYTINGDLAFKPTVYLSSDIIISDGVGTASNPYILAPPKPKLPLKAANFANLLGHGGLVVTPQSETEQLRVTTDYRYIGSNPDNYVKFNNELWRIIGVFEVDDGTGKFERRIKLIRKDSIGNISWDDNVDGTESSNWSSASGMILLNKGDYWNKLGIFSSIGLTENSKSMLSNAKWYLGGIEQIESNNIKSVYSKERGTKVYNGRSTSWTGKVGLMYPSDYGYATNGGESMSRGECIISTPMSSWDAKQCKDNDWLYFKSDEWTFSSRPTYSDPFGVSSAGSVKLYYVSNTNVFRPCVYLSSSIKISGGTGTESNPYQLST